MEFRACIGEVSGETRILRSLRTHLTATILSALGADVRMRLYPGRPHLVSDAEIADARALLETL